MPTLSIGDKSVTVGDDFLKLSQEQQDATVEDIAKSLEASGKPDVDPVSTNDVVRSAATGVPVVGGVLNKLNAATNATLAPVVEPLLSPSKDDISRNGESWAQRYRKSLDMQDAGDAKFAAQHPIVDTVGKLAGGVAGSIPMMAAAPAAFGLTGTLPQMVARGAASNAALGAADAAVRGDDIGTAAAIGGGTGAVLPLVARGVGKGVQAFRDMRNPVAPVAQTTESVAGVNVPLTKGQAALDPQVQAEEEIIRRGGRGGSAEAVARQADDEAKAAIGEASSKIGGSLDPRNLPKPVSAPPEGVPADVMAAAHHDFKIFADDPTEVAAASQRIADQYGPQAAAAYEGEIKAISAHEAARANASSSTSPQAAAETVSTELQAQRQAANALETQQAIQVGEQGNALARGLNGGAVPVSQFDAAGGIGTAVTKARDAKVAATKAAYKARDAVEGAFDDSFPQGLAEDIRGRLNTNGDPAERLWVDPTNESTANKALKLIDQDVGAGLFKNAAAPAEAPEAIAARQSAQKLTDDLLAQGIKPEKAAESAARAFNLTPEQMAGPVGPKVDLPTLDNARKRLVTMFGDAKSRAIATGDKSDMRAMGKILEEFDNAVSDALAGGKFSGDAEAAQKLQAAARKSHSEYRQTFSSRGPGDEIGRSVEKILGRYTDSAATPDEIAKMAYGSAANPGGGKAAKVAGRLKSILGESSPEWGRYKQGLFSHLTDTGPGGAERTAAQTADRIDMFLHGQTGKVLADEVFTTAERSNLSNYANSLRSLKVRGPAVNDLERALARITGADGHLPASPTEVADMLYSRTGKGDKGISVRLAHHLKQNLTPDGWTAVRQGMWERLTNAGEGKIELGPQALSQKLHEFLNESGKPLAGLIFTAPERAEMAKLAAVYKKMTPLKGTTNPSGTAPMLAKIADKASNNLLALIGLGAHGVSGAIAGHAIQSIGKTVKEARQAKKAVGLFFGEQPKRAAVRTRISPAVGALAIAGPTSQR